MVLIAHDLSVVRYMCDRVAVMYMGSIVETAPSDVLFSHPRHPYPGALLSAVPVADLSGSHGRKRQILHGELPSPSDPPSACRFHTRCPRIQQVCSQETPALEAKQRGSLAACHFPLTDDDDVARISPI